MKVLLVSSGSGSRGGGEIYLQFLADGLSRLGHEVHALVSTAPILDELAQRLNATADVHRLDFCGTYTRKTRNIGALFDRKQQHRLAKFYRALAPDILHINQQVAEDGLDLLLAAHRSGLPRVSTIHITRSAESLGAIFGSVRDRVTETLLRRLQCHHIVVAEHARRDLVERLGCDSVQRVTVVHNGVGLSNLAAEGMSRSSIRAEWGFGSDHIVLGSVGRLEPQKNPLILMDIFCALRQHNRAVKLVWIGDGPLRARMLARAQELSLSDEVIIDGWRNDVRQRLTALDIFVLPSLFEGLPLALLEAMSAGLPICASDADGMEEAINHGISGFLCHSQDVSSWVVNIERLMAEPVLRNQLGQTARSVAQSHFSVSRMSERTHAVYMQILRSESSELRSAAS